MQICGIYKIQNKITGMIYIGSSKSIEHRWRGHKKALRRGIHPNNRIQNSWNKHGEENFIFETLEQCNEDNKIVREQWWIDNLDTMENGYNLASANCSILSEESKRKISEANKGQIPWCKGKKLSEEHKHKISESHKGIKVSEETKKKISVTLTGREGNNKGTHMSKETRNKIRNSILGKKHSKASIQKMKEVHKGFKHSEESKKKMSEIKILRDQDPEYKKKLSEGAKRMWERRKIKKE